MKIAACLLSLQIMLVPPLTDLPETNHSELLRKAKEFETMATELEVKRKNQGHGSYQLILNSLRQIYAELGDKDRLNKAFQKSVTLDPSNSFLLADYASFLERDKQYPEAERILWSLLISESRTKPSGMMMPDQATAFLRTWKPDPLPEHDQIEKLQGLVFSDNEAAWKKWCDKIYIYQATTEIDHLTEFYLRRADFTKALQFATMCDKALIDYLPRGMSLGGVTLSSELDCFYAQAHSKAQLCKCLYAASDWNRLADEAKHWETFESKARKERSKSLDDETDAEPLIDEREAQFHRAEALRHVGRPNEAIPLYLELFRYKNRVFPYLKSQVWLGRLQKLQLVQPLNAMIADLEAAAKKENLQGNSEQATANLKLALSIATEVPGDEQDNIDNFWDKAGLTNFPQCTDQDGVSIAYTSSSQFYKIAGTLLSAADVEFLAESERRRLQRVGPNPALARITSALKLLEHE